MGCASIKKDLPHEVVEGEALLNAYFQSGYLEGELYSGPKYRRIIEQEFQLPVLEHIDSGIKVWNEVLDLRAEAPDDSVMVLYHYTGRIGFANVARNSASDRELFASLEDSTGGRGVFTVSKEPNRFRSNEPLIVQYSWSHKALVNPAHYPNDTSLYAGLPNDSLIGEKVIDDEQWRAKVEFCIPIIVATQFAYQILECMTPDLAQRGAMEKGARPEGWIIRLPESCARLPKEDGGAVKIERARKRVQHSEGTLGTRHPDTLRFMSDLAALLQSEGYFDEAEHYQRLNLRLREETLGPTHPDTLNSLSGLAELLRARGKREEAESHHRLALRGREETLGPSHPSTMTSMNNLASLLQSMGKFQEAEQLYRCALALQEETRGNIHPETLLFVGNLATLLIAIGNYQEAEHLCHRALQGRMETLGPSHPDTLTALNELALLLQGMGNHTDAEVHLRNALTVQEKVRGPTHPDTLISVNNLAFLLQAAGKAKDAEPLHRRILHVCEETLGPSHLDTLISCSRLGMLLLYSIGQPLEAEPLLRRSLAGMEAQLGPFHVQTDKTRHALKDLLKQTGRQREARDLRKQHKEAANHILRTRSRREDL